MNINRRTWLASALALPMGGCAIQYLPSLATEAVAPPAGDGARVRPPAVGQVWTYRQFNMFNSALVATVREQVASADAAGVVVRRTADGQAVLPDEVHAAWGLLRTDPVWDMPLHLMPAAPLWAMGSDPALLPQPGDTRLVHGHYAVAGGSFAYWVQVYVVVRGWERVAVGDSVHTALRVERLLRLAHPDATRIETQRRDVFWLRPDIGRWVARETSGRRWFAGLH